MKKMMTLVLAFVLAMSMTMTAFAEELTLDNDTTEIYVSGNYVTGDEADTVVSVDVAWDDMEFTYTGATEGTWNTETHSYDGYVAGDWSTKTATITVTNHSNSEITARCLFESNVENVNGKFDNDKYFIDLELKSADADEYREAVDGVYPAPSKSTEFGIGGAPIAGDVDELGTITVSIIVGWGE